MQLSFTMNPSTEYFSISSVSLLLMWPQAQHWHHYLAHPGTLLHPVSKYAASSIQVSKVLPGPKNPVWKGTLSVEPAVSTAAIYSMPSLFCHCACLTVIYIQHPHLVIFCFTFMSLTLVKNLTLVSVYFLSLLALFHSITSLCFSSSCSSYSFTLISWHSFLLH